MIAVIHDFGFRNTIDSSKLITDSLYMHTGFKNRMRIIWYKKTMIEKNNPFLKQRLSNFFLFNSMKFVSYFITQKELSLLCMKYPS